jgi:hypothetical protein
MGYRYRKRENVCEKKKSKTNGENYFLNGGPKKKKKREKEIFKYKPL